MLLFRTTVVDEPPENATELDRRLYDKRMFTIVSMPAILGAHVNDK